MKSHWQEDKTDKQERQKRQKRQADRQRGGQDSQIGIHTNKHTHSCLLENSEGMVTMDALVNVLSTARLGELKKGS